MDEDAMKKAAKAAGLTPQKIYDEKMKSISKKQCPKDSKIEARALLVLAKKGKEYFSTITTGSSSNTKRNILMESDPFAMKDDELDSFIRNFYADFRMSACNGHSKGMKTPIKLGIHVFAIDEDESAALKLAQKAEKILKTTGSKFNVISSGKNVEGFMKQMLNDKIDIKGNEGSFVFAGKMLQAFSTEEHNCTKPEKKVKVGKGDADVCLTDLKEGSVIAGQMDPWKPVLETIPVSDLSAAAPTSIFLPLLLLLLCVALVMQKRM